MQPARNAALDWPIRKLGNDLLTLLHEAVTQPQDAQMPLLLTLDSNRVYIGWIVRSPNLKTEDEYLSVLPLASGHRHKDTLKVTLDTFYPVHEYAGRGGAIDPNKLTFVIPYESIGKANYFDLELYMRYFAAGTGAASEQLA